MITGSRGGRFCRQCAFGFSVNIDGSCQWTLMPRSPISGPKFPMERSFRSKARSPFLRGILNIADRDCVHVACPLPAIDENSLPPGGEGGRFMRLCKLRAQNDRATWKGGFASPCAPRFREALGTEQRRGYGPRLIGRPLSRESAIKMVVTSQGTRARMGDWWGKTADDCLSI